jgi:hypothetical protein
LSSKIKIKAQKKVLLYLGRRRNILEALHS